MQENLPNSHMMPMFYNKSEEYVAQVIRQKKPNMFFFGGYSVRFLRVALKNLHHTREAMSTAKSIRALCAQHSPECEAKQQH